MKRLAIALLVVLCGCSSQPDGGRETLPSIPKGEPGDLVGLSGPQLQGMFGKAAFSRKENGSEVWRYDNPQCRAFFFLYSEESNLRVRHIETIPKGKKQAADPACLNLLRAKPASPLS